ncbi:MAG TPA: malectin domain-containing carbohydrate-binding protein [Polyangia bacterium]|nr:malectin domain-containing carbohydrate-binding protein [Polyangia bacterium]
MTYGIPSGTAVPITVAGQNITPTTAGGHIVVTYRCDPNGELCRPYAIKDFWLGLNSITVNGLSFSNITFSSAGTNGFRADNTLDPTGPGFRVSASVDGVAGPMTFVQPTGAEKFTGALRSAPFTFSSLVDVPILYGNSPLGVSKAHVSMNLSGTSYGDSGSAGGVQISTGTTTAIGNFVADKDVSGGAQKTRTSVIDLAGAINPAPMEVYQSQHYGTPFTYTIPGFTAGSSHLVRLHFAETNPVNNAPNKRKFSVMVNGITQISNLDLFATVGMNHAYIWECTLTANSAGQYVLSFSASLDAATVSAIEIL